MAVTSVSANNKLVVFRKEVTREYIRQNLFSPYIGTEMTAIIRVINDLKNGGEQINIPLVARLKGQPVATGTLVGNEEAIDNYGDRAWIDWARNAVKIPKSEEQKARASTCSVRLARCSKTGARSCSATKSSTRSSRSRSRRPLLPASAPPTVSASTALCSIRRPPRSEHLDHRQR
jgi:hypothetical protein